MQKGSSVNPQTSGRALQAQAQCIREISVIIALLGAGVLCEVLAAMAVLKPHPEPLASWIGRSGALTSICCIIAQVRIGTFRESIKGGAFFESWWLYRLFVKQLNAIELATTLVAVWGAFVWGYGDVILPWLLPHWMA